MKFERVQPGTHRAELYNRIGEYLWVIRRGRKWYWFLGSYSGDNLYFSWETYDDDYEGPFPSMKKAISDAIKRLMSP
jgi:hypothetical protein